MSTTDDTTARCAVCDTPSNLVCADCKAISFCSRECQEATYISHKIFCTQYKDFQEKDRPGKNFRLVAFFPPTGDKAELKWLKMQNIQGDNLDDDEGVAMRDLLDRRPSRMVSFTKNPYTGKELEHTLEIRYDDEFRFKYKKGNSAVHHASNDLAKFKWGGPIIVARAGPLDDFDSDSEDSDYESFEQKENAYVFPDGDITLRDLCQMSACLADFRNNTPANLQRMGPKFTCVKIPCDGEIRIMGSKKCEQVVVPRQHVDWGYGMVSPISERIGMPLIMYPYLGRRKEWTSNSDLANDRIECMQMGVDPLEEGPDSRCFGGAPLGWIQVAGNVLIARVDRKHLDPELIDAFADFCSEHLPHYFGQAKDRENDVEFRVPGKMGTYMQKMLDKHVTPEAWEEYLEKWRADKAAEEETDESDDDDGDPEETNEYMRRMLELLTGRSGSDNNAEEEEEAEEATDESDDDDDGLPQDMNEDMRRALESLTVRSELPDYELA